MSLEAGTHLGPYEVLAAVGAGGMGEVYRARDTKLGREVAIKVLPEAFASDRERLRRFEREAKLLAALNHPNIAAIYGLEESGGVPALVMELVAGATLAERIAKDPIPLDEALPIARQIAEGLEYAHEHGIIHRDLKPANVKVADDGKTKILDFGLAKALEPEGAPGDLSQSPTLSDMATRRGVILGTAAYMAPEQAKGKPVNRRADIWAFGCLFYEMLAGASAFGNDTVTEVLAAILKEEPDWTLLPRSTPPAVVALIRRCLAKDPRQRLQAIGDARIAIDEALTSGPGDTAALDLAEPEQSGHPIAPRSFWRNALPWVAGPVAGALLTALLFWGLLLPRSRPAARFSSVTKFAGAQEQPALSPDGHSVAFVSNRDGPYNIYVGLVGGEKLVQVTHDPNLESRPSWSPDGLTLAYGRLDHSGIWDIWEVPALGGEPRRIILHAMDPTFSSDGKALAYMGGGKAGLWIAGVDGENPREVVPGRTWIMPATPRFSPDGRKIAFTYQLLGPFGELEVLDLASGQVSQLTHDGRLALSPAWSADGRFLYFASTRGGTMNLWKIAATGGEPEQITSGQGDDAGLDVSTDGKRIVFSTWRENLNITRIDLEPGVEPHAVKLLTRDPLRSQLFPAYSPDGRRLAYVSGANGVMRAGIWLANADGSAPVKLVWDRHGGNVMPTWAPGGRSLIYESLGVNPNEFRIIPVTGGTPRTFFKREMRASDFDFWDLDVGRDGRLLFLAAKNKVESFDPRSNRAETIATPPAGETWLLVQWSPDERSIAYVVKPNREDDPNAGLWVNDLKDPPHQIFRGWVDCYARGPANEIYLVEGKPDLNAVVWKVGWDGRNLTRLPVTIPLVNSYWSKEGRNPQDRCPVSPDGRSMAISMQSVLQANIGMIENPP